jgi:hypothetical protein
MIRKSFGFIPALTAVGLVALMVASAQVTLQKIAGTAKDIAIGANNQIWIIGADNTAYSRSNNTWKKQNSTALNKIAVDPQGNAWAIAKSDNRIVRFNKNAWSSFAGKAQDIGIGANGTVFSVSLTGDVVPLIGSSWGKSIGRAAQIAVDSKGNPWTIGANDEISRYVGGKPQRIPGAAKSIAIAANGTVYVLGADFNRIWLWDGNMGWNVAASVPDATRVATDKSGTLFVLNKKGEIQRVVTAPPPPTPPAPTAPDARANFNNLVLGFPKWEAFSPTLPDQNRAIGGASRDVQAVDRTAYDCTTTPYSITETPDKIVTFSPDANVLWAGALLQGKGYKLGIGSLKELPIRQRTPLGLSVSLQTAGNSATIPNPDNVSVGAAIGEIIGNAEKNGIKPATSISYLKTDSFSAEQIALSLGISAKYMGSSAKATFNFNRSVNERTITAIFRETAFTVSVAAPQTISSYLSNKFSQADLDSQIAQGNIGSDNIPVYVSSITYGRMLMFSLTSTASTQEMSATLDALYKGGTIEAEGNLSAAQKRVLQNSRISVATIGGDADNARRLIASGRLADYFSQTNSLSTYKPVSYEIRNLGDGSIAKLSETSNYNVTQCSALTAKKVGERWVNVIDGIYLNNAGDGETGDIYGLGGLEGAAGLIFNIPENAPVVMKTGSVFGANRQITVPGINTFTGDGRFDTNNNFVVRDYFNAAPRNLDFIVFLVDRDSRVLDDDDAIIARGENNPIVLSNPFGGSDKLQAVRVDGAGRGTPGSATVIYRQKKLCNLLEDPISKQVIPEENCISASLAIAQP